MGLEEISLKNYRIRLLTVRIHLSHKRKALKRLRLRALVDCQIVFGLDSPSVLLLVKAVSDCNLVPHDFVTEGGGADSGIIIH